jgi:hypothetical protein
VCDVYGELTLVAAALAFTTHIDTIKYTTHNSSKFGAGAQTAAPGPRSTLETHPAPPTPRHGHRRVGVYAPRRERQYLRRALGIVGFFGCG